MPGQNVLKASTAELSYKLNLYEFTIGKLSSRKMVGER